MGDLTSILKIAKKPKRIVPVAVGRETYHVRGQSAANVDVALAGERDDPSVSFRVRIVTMALCEADGTPLCPEPEKHYADIGELPNGVLRDLYLSADEASGLPPGGLEELAGNSGARANGSADGSPSPSGSRAPATSSAA